MTQPAGGDAQSFPCSNCGAKLNYDAGTQAMKCPYCGHQQAVQTRPAVVQQAGYVIGSRPALVGAVAGRVLRAR